MVHCSQVNLSMDLLICWIFGWSYSMKLYSENLLNSSKCKSPPICSSFDRQNRGTIKRAPTVMQNHLLSVCLSLVCTGAHARREESKGLSDVRLLWAYQWENFLRRTTFNQKLINRRQQCRRISPFLSDLLQVSYAQGVPSARASGMGWLWFEYYLILSSCPAASAKFPSTQVESGQQLNIKIQVNPMPRRCTSRWDTLYSSTPNLWKAGCNFGIALFI